MSTSLYIKMLVTNTYTSNLEHSFTVPIDTLEIIKIRILRHLKKYFPDLITFKIIEIKEIED